MMINQANTIVKPVSMNNCECVLPDYFSQQLLGFNQKFADIVNQCTKKMINDQIEYTTQVIRNELLSEFDAMPINTLKYHLNRLGINIDKHVLMALEKMEENNEIGIFKTQTGIKRIYLKQKEDKPKDLNIDNPRNKLEMDINRYDENGKKETIMHYAIVDIDPYLLKTISMYDLRDFIEDAYDSVDSKINEVVTNFIPIGVLLSKP